MIYVYVCMYTYIYIYTHTYIYTYMMACCSRTPLGGLAPSVPEAGKGFVIGTLRGDELRGQREHDYTCRIHICLYWWGLYWWKNP